MENDNPQTDDRIIFDEFERKLDEEIALCSQLDDMDRGFKAGLMKAKVLLYDVFDRVDELDGE